VPDRHDGRAVDVQPGQVIDGGGDVVERLRPAAADATRRYSMFQQV